MGHELGQEVPRLLRKLSAWITENGFRVGFPSASSKNLFLDSVYLAELAPRKKKGRGPY